MAEDCVGFISIFDTATFPGYEFIRLNLNAIGILIPCDNRVFKNEFLRATPTCIV